MRPLLRANLLALAAALCGAQSPAQDKSYQVGTHGAKVELDRTWRREKKDGADQFDGSQPTRLFGRSKEMWIVVTEVRALVETDADLGCVLDARGSHGDGQPFTVVRGASWLRATRDVATDDWAIRYEVLAKDGLAYHLMCWADPRDVEFLHERADDFVAGFEPPPADRTWRKELEPKQQVIPDGDAELTFTVRPFLLATVDGKNGSLCELQSPDKQHGVQVFEVQNQFSLRAALDDETRRLRAWDASFEPRQRGESEVDGEKRGLLIGETRSRSVATLVVPAGERRWVFFRYWSPGAAKDARPERDALFASVKHRAADGALQLPSLADASPPARDDAVARLCRELPAVATLDGVWATAAVRDGDGWLVQSWSDLWHAGPAGTEPLWSQHGGTWFAFRWRGELLIGANHDVQRADNARLVGDALFAANQAAPVQDDLLVVRTEPAPLAELMQHGSDVLVRRTPAGGETTLVRLQRDGANKLIVSPDQHHALLSGSDGARIDRAFGPWLAAIDIESGAMTELGDWDFVESLGPAGADWLVTGTPRGEPRGIWLVRSTGEREPLLTGAVVQGIEVVGEQLVLLQRSGQRSYVRELSLARCRDQGRYCQPFTADRLAAIGERLAAELGADGAPHTAAAVIAARQRASSIAKAAHGCELPAAAVDVDALVAAVAGMDVAPQARAVLGILIAAAALDFGGEWVDAPASWSDWQLAGMRVDESPMAYPMDPRQLLTQSLDPEYGGVSVALAPDRANARRLLLGLDTAALRQRAAALLPADLEAAIARGDIARLAAIFDGAPANGVLRREVYARLARAGRVDAVDALAAPRAAVAEPLAEDLVASLAVASTLMPDAAAAREVFDRAMRAVQLHPRDGRLYLSLGRAAARAFPEQPVKARQCFDRVLALHAWGTVADAAKRERAALDKH